MRVEPPPHSCQLQDGQGQSRQHQPGLGGGEEAGLRPVAQVRLAVADPEALVVREAGPVPARHEEATPLNHALGWKKKERELHETVVMRTFSKVIAGDETKSTRK